MHSSMNIPDIVSTCVFHLRSGHEVKTALQKLAAINIPLEILQNYHVEETVFKYINVKHMRGVPELAIQVIRKINNLEEEEKRRCPPPVYAFNNFLQKRRRAPEDQLVEPSTKRSKF